MKAFVGVTDHAWFRYLRRRSDLEEINFWQPGGNRQFRALQENEPFLFKLRSPQNYIVGGGLFVKSYLLPLSQAWSAFEQGNGAPNFSELRRRISAHRQSRARLWEDFTIGCIILRGAVFLDDAGWIPVPGALTGNSPGKTFDAGDEPIASIWEQVRLGAIATRGIEEIGEQRPIFGEPRLYKPRLGQGTFRIEVARTYSGSCAVTDERALPTLDAAHIKPVAEGGEHRLDNGILLRSDVHRLFDRGYVTVDDRRRVRVSRRLRDEFDNGEPYFPLDGKQISLPPRPEDRPRREFLEWHADTVFRA